MLGGIYFYFSLHLASITLLFILIPLLYLTMTVIRAVEKTAFIKAVPPQKLTEGDWLSEPVIVDKKVIVDTGYSGVTKQEIARLIALNAQGKIKKVVMRIGIPFVPSFLAGYVITIMVGNWFALLL